MINEARNFAHKQFKKRKIQSFGNFGNSVSAIFKNEKHVKKDRRIYENEQNSN